MIKFISFILIMAGFGYLINYFFNNSMDAFSVNGAYREMSQKTCREISDALVAPADTDNRKKADIYLQELAEPRFHLQKMKEDHPLEWQRLVAQFQNVCAGNTGLPGDEIIQHIDRVNIMGQTN